MRGTIVRRLGVGLLASALAVVALLSVTPYPAEAAEVTQGIAANSTGNPNGSPPPTAPVVASALWQGTASSAAVNVRSAPNTTAPVVATLPLGAPVTVTKWVTGEEVETENTTWAQIGDGRYVYSARIHKDAPAGPPPLPNGVLHQGKWIDVNLTQQVITAYDGAVPVHVAVTSSGRPDYPTPQGDFTILRRVANETMTSAGLPWIKDSYSLNNVLFTQYFTSMGAAIHEAWWKKDGSFGIPTSHACLGLPYNEALWFWNWASEGTPMSIHS